MPSEEVRAASQACSQILEADDALQQHTIPSLGLRKIMQLAGTCRAWHHFISGTPLCHLSEEARRAVLPSGLTSSLPLLQLVKQQAQLLARLRGKDSFRSGIQRLSFRDDLLDGSRQGNVQQSTSVHVALLGFKGILWSPCSCLEHASRWLVLNPNQARKHLPIVLDTETGWQVCFQEGPLPLYLTPHGEPILQAACLFDRPGQVLFFLSTGEILGSIACRADAHSQSTLPIVLPGGQFSGTCRFFTVCNEEGSAFDILCWNPEPEPGKSLEPQISMFHASSRRPLYQLSCPKQLHDCFQRLPMVASRHDQHGSDRGQPGHGVVVGCKVLLAPSKQLLAVVWQNRPWIRRPLEEWRSHMGLSIHSAAPGELLHSMLLMTGTVWEFMSCQPGWLPRSSKFMYVSNDGCLRLITSSGCQLWTNFLADRNPDWIMIPAGYDIAATLSVSPCGRWILVMEVEAPRQHMYSANPSGHITVVEASKGRNLAGYHVPHSFYGPKGRWSMSGDICLLEQVDCVLVYCPHADPALTTFQQYELPDRLKSSPMHTFGCPSLSPCGSIAVSID